MLCGSAGGRNRRSAGHFKKVKALKLESPGDSKSDKRGVQPLCFDRYLGRHFNIFSRNFHRFLPPTARPPRHTKTRHQHLTLGTFVTSGSFSAVGTNCLLRQQHRLGSRAATAETQTVKIVSDERSAPFPLPSLKRQRIFFSRRVFIFFFYPGVCTDIYSDVFQAGAICKIRNKKTRAEKKHFSAVSAAWSVEKVLSWHTSIKAKFQETPHVFPPQRRVLLGDAQNSAGNPKANARFCKMSGHAGSLRVHAPSIQLHASSLNLTFPSAVSRTGTPPPSSPAVAQSALPHADQGPRA